MESRLRERLTGALIVVVALVIMVPEMLPGPGKSPATANAGGDAGPPVRTFSLELGSSATPRTEDQSALTPQSSEPVVASPATPESAERAAESTSDMPEAVANGQWWVQVGSFSSRDNAERFAGELRGKGYLIHVARLRMAGKDLYRVRAGPVASREAAVALQSRLAAAGHKSSLVAP